MIRGFVYGGVGNSDREMQEGEEAVLKVLEARHDREEQARQDAKEVYCILFLK